MRQAQEIDYMRIWRLARISRVALLPPPTPHEIRATMTAGSAAPSDVGAQGNVRDIFLDPPATATASDGEVFDSLGFGHVVSLSAVAVSTGTALGHHWIRRS